MRSNELNYIDHPFFGLLIKIIPIKHEDEPIPLAFEETPQGEPGETEHDTETLEKHRPAVKQQA